MKPFKTILLVGIALMGITILSGPANAADNPIRIASGPKTGEYINIAQSICDAFGLLFSCQSMETKGTLDNKKRLESNEAEFGFAKANVADEWMKIPEFAARFTVVRRIGDESLFAFAKPETMKAIGSWTGVRDNAFLLSLGLPGEFSGDAAVFNSLKGVPGSPLASLTVKMFKDRPSLVQAVATSEVQLGFITQVPNPSNELFTLINKAGLMIMGIVDPDMITFGETFRIKAVTVKNAKWFGVGGTAAKIETANVPVAILAVKPESLQGRATMIQQAAIKKIQDVPEAHLLPKQGWFQDLANTASIKAGGEFENVMKSMKEAANGAKERLKQLEVMK